MLLLCGIFALANVFADISLSFADVCIAIIATALMSLFMTSLTVLLSQTSLGISVTFALTVTSLVLSGGLIPSAMLPYEVTVLGSFTPFGLYSSSLAPLLGGNVSDAVLLLTVPTVLLFAAACAYMKRITVKGGGEK